jgi:protein-disulfide isomerase
MTESSSRFAMPLLAILGVAAIGGAALIWRSSPAEADWAASAASGLTKKEVEKIVRDYIVNNPEVLMEAMSNLQAKEENAQREKLSSGVAKFSKDLFENPVDFVAGNPKGDVTIVEFFDYRCGYCKKARPEVLKLIESDKNVRVVVKEFPILGAPSEFASRAALASKKQGKYWDLHLALMAEPSIDEVTVMEIARSKGLDIAKLTADMNSKDVTEAIRANRDLAQKMGIDSTPTFIFGKQPIAGAVPLAQMKEMIAQARKGG